MVCVPCFVIPVIVFFWKVVEYLLATFWPKKAITAEKNDKSKNDFQCPVTNSSKSSEPSDVTSESSTENKKEN